ncbi:MAG: hypothetical protein Q4B09_05415 [Lachnospiraceae bacterium]|nr:hypothetical protein [Lachnospiraceae bacterium]
MADVFNINNKYLDYLKLLVKSDIDKVRYKIDGSNWKDAQIVSIEVQNTGQIALTFIIDLTKDNAAGVKEIAIYSRKGIYIANRQLTLTRKNASEAIEYVVRFNIFQASENIITHEEYDLSVIENGEY